MEDQERFDEAVRELARKDGVEHILSIDGVWECVSEYYNNDAIDLMRENEEVEEINLDGAIVTQPGENIIDKVRSVREEED